MKLATQLEYQAAKDSRALFLDAIQEIEERMGTPGVTDNEVTLLALERDAAREQADELLRAMITWERKDR